MYPLNSGPPSTVSFFMGPCIKIQRSNNKSQLTWEDGLLDKMAYCKEQNPSTTCVTFQRWPEAPKRKKLSADVCWLNLSGSVEDDVGAETGGWTRLQISQRKSFAAWTTSEHAPCRCNILARRSLDGWPNEPWSLPLKSLLLIFFHLELFEQLVDGHIHFDVLRANAMLQPVVICLRHKWGNPQDFSSRAQFLHDPQRSACTNHGGTARTIVAQGDSNKGFGTKGALQPARAMRQRQGGTHHACQTAVSMCLPPASDWACVQLAPFIKAAANNSELTSNAARLRYSLWFMGSASPNWHWINSCPKNTGSLHHALQQQSSTTQGLLQQN